MDIRTLDIDLAKNVFRAYPVQSKYLLLRLAFDRNKSHRWSSHRYDQRIGKLARDNKRAGQLMKVP